jgi:hypothetical protein
LSGEAGDGGREFEGAHGICPASLVRVPMN